MTTKISFCLKNTLANCALKHLQFGVGFKVLFRRSNIQIGSKTLFDLQRHCNHSAVRTYHPWLVTEIVDRVQRVDTWQSSILQSNHHVSVVPILVHAESVLPDQHEVWLERSETLTKYQTMHHDK